MIGFELIYEDSDFEYHGLPHRLDFHQAAALWRADVEGFCAVGLKGELEFPGLVIRVVLG